MDNGQLKIDNARLPKGWKIKKLGDVLKLEYGKPLDKSKRKLDGQYPVYGANGEKSRTNEIYYDKQSIIVGRKGSAGEVNLTETKFWPLDVTYFVTFDEKKFDLFFLFHLLSKSNLPKLAKGVKPGINRNDVYSISVNTPQLPEQKRIVKILDKAFTAIDKAKHNAEKNLHNAKELFESYLNGVFANPGEDWEIKKLGEVIATSQIGLVRNSEEQSPEFSCRYFKMNNIRNDNGLNENSFTFIEATKEDVEKYCLKNGDFLFNTRNSYELVGKTCLYQSDYKEPTLFNNNILRVTFNKYLLSQFVAFAFSSNQIKEELERMKSGTTSVVGIYYKSLKNLKIPIPPLPEQKRIVAKLDSLSAETKRLEKIYQQKIADAEELKKSILQKAFNGEL